MCMHKRNAHVSTDDDGEDKDTRHLRYNSCNVATDVRGRGREAGKMSVCVCLLPVRMCVSERGAAPQCVVNPLSLYFRNCCTLTYIFYLTFNYASYVSRRNFAFFSHFFFSRFLSSFFWLVSHGHLWIHIASPANNSTSSFAKFSRIIISSEIMSIFRNGN